MDIDLAALRALEREKEIPLDLLIRTIEQALLLAYHRTEDAQKRARVELDRATGHVIVWAQEVDDAGVPGKEYDDTPAAAADDTPAEPAEADGDADPTG